jgi:phosphodiesterase/alkaline phosphatase D-like protein
MPGLFKRLLHRAERNADEPLNYVVHLGDYIYETVSQTGVVRAVPPLPSGGSVAATLADYRHLYRTYRSDAALQRVHESSLSCKPGTTMNSPTILIRIFTPTIRPLQEYRTPSCVRPQIKPGLESLSSMQNLVAVSGDIHSFMAGYMKPFYDSIAHPRLGVEFVGASVTSSNLAEILESADLRSTSAPVPPRLLKQAFPNGLVSLIARVMNPELEFFDSEKHGYIVLEIRPESVTCLMRAVSTVRQTDATVSTLASFVVPSGQRRIIRS